MRGRTTLLVAVLGAVLGAPASAAPAPPQITDQRNDANGVHNQGFDAPDVSRPTEPASYAAADIVAVRLATTYARRRATGVTVTMALAAPPVDGVSYQFRADVAGCTWLHVWYEHVDGRPLTRVHCGGVGWAASVPAAKVVGSTIVWSLPFASPAGWIRPGSVLTGLEADTSASRFVAAPSGAPEEQYGARPVELDRAVSDAVFHVGR